MGRRRQVDIRPAFGPSADRGTRQRLIEESSKAIEDRTFSAADQRLDGGDQAHRQAIYQVVELADFLTTDLLGEQLQPRLELEQIKACRTT